MLDFDRGGSFIGIPFDNNSKSNQDRIYLGIKFLTTVRCDV